MPLEIAARAQRDRRRAMGWWVVGSSLYALVIVATYPSMQGQDELNELMEDYPPELIALFAGGETTFDLTSAADYLNSQLFAFILPLLLAILAVGFGAGTLAGEEERGTLDLVLSYPVARRRLVLEKGLVLVAEVVTLTAAVYLVSFGLGGLFEVDLPWSNVALSAVGQVLLGTTFGFLALAMGALSGSRGLALGVGAGAAGATYLLGSLAPVVSWLEPFKWLSPFYYATGDNPLANGLPAWRLGVVVAVSAVLLVSSVAAFARRDLRG
jgi:ABC-2 type transport system permease protein